MQNKAVQNIKMLTFILIAFFFFSLYPQSPLSSFSAKDPFGGKIGFYFPHCNVTHNSILQVTLPKPKFLTFTSGAKVYPFGPPSHPGQELLGEAGGSSMCLVTCGSHVCKIGPSGAVIRYLGSSV